MSEPIPFLRDVTTAFDNALHAPQLRVAQLVYIDHPDGAVYVWSGVGNLDWNGNTYQGIGALGGINGVESTAPLKISEVTFVLTNVPVDLLADVNTDVKGRQAEVYFALLTDNMEVIPDPILIMLVDLDYQAAKIEDDGTATLYLTGSTGLWRLEQPSLVSWSPEEHKKTYPADTGLDMVPDMESKEVTWTRI